MPGIIHLAPGHRQPGKPRSWACGLQELDLVSPLLYLLSLCLPGGRFWRPGMLFTGQPVLLSFTEGYRSATPMHVDWDVVCCHAMSWTLSHAGACREGRSRDEGGAQSAVSIALRVAEAFGVLPGKSAV